MGCTLSRASPTTLDEDLARRRLPPMPQEQHAPQAASDELHVLDPVVRKALSAFDGPLVETLKASGIRLLRSEWLLQQPMRRRRVIVNQYGGALSASLAYSAPQSPASWLPPIS